MNQLLSIYQSNLSHCLFLLITELFGQIKFQGSQDDEKTLSSSYGIVI